MATVPGTVKSPETDPPPGDDDSGVSYAGTVFAVTLFGLFALAAFTGAWLLDGTQTRLDRDGVAASAVITGKKTKWESSGASTAGRHRVFSLSYRFTLTNGTIHNSGKYVDKDTYARLSVGDELKVRYNKNNPERHQIVEDEYGEGADAVRAFAWVFTALAGIVLLFAMSGALKRRFARP